MGITGLLPFLEKSSKKTNIAEFSGGTVAIDTYCWLHKGVFSCAEKLMTGQTTNAYVLYCARYINMLLKHDIKPILVFDGRRLPAKEQTEIKRRESRQMNRRKAIKLIQMGQIAEGRNLLKRAIDITHEIALELIKYCQSQNIDCIVAPYEADAQLAYLNINGIADVVITEDSDLTLFECKKMFFKMDINGNGVLIEQSRLHLAMNMQPEQFNMDKFRYICILSGCDYLSSLPGIGLGKARKFITKNTDDNIHKALSRIGSTLNMKSLVATQEYRDAFILANITFKHQLVFCPLQRKQVRLNPPTADITEDQLWYAGKELDGDLALQLALGNCDPSNLKMLHDFNPDKIERKKEWNTGARQMAKIRTSIWSNNYDVKMENMSSSGNATKSCVITERKLPRKDSLKDEFIPSKLLNSSTGQSDMHTEIMYNMHQNLSDGTILEMYNRQDDKTSPVSAEQGTRQSSYTENNVSPELRRQKNPFVKRVSDLMTSPSILSSGNCQKRGKNLIRIKRTIVNENTVIKSKYFLERGNERYDALELENNVEDTTSKSTKYNIIPDIGSDINDSEASREQRETTLDLVENKNSMEDVDNVLLTSRNKRLTNSYGNILEKLYPSDTIAGVPPATHCTTDENNISNHSLMSSSSDDPIDHGNTNNLQEGPFKWSNAINDRISSRKTLGHLKKPSSANLVLRTNSAKKRTRQSKQLSVSAQRSLLDMYGFQRR